MVKMIKKALSRAKFQAENEPTAELCKGSQVKLRLSSQRS